MDATGIETLIGDGDYFEALGVHPGTPATEIAVTAARLAARYPEQARVINAVAAVLREPRQREIYLIARQERDAVLHRELPPQLREAVPDARGRVWDEIQRLLHCTFQLGQIGVGPRGARSLARRHEWIREAVVNSAFPVLTPHPAERRAGTCYRVLTFRPDCPDCGGDPTVECHCRDTFRFDIPSGAAPGTLLGAPGERTGRFTYMILDRAVLAPRPYRAISAVYYFHGLRGAGGQYAQDLTLEEAGERTRNGAVWLLLVFIALCTLLGWLTSTWLVGLTVALPTLIASYFVNRGAVPPRRYWRYWTVALTVQPLLGAGGGVLSGAMLSGFVTGLVASGVIGGLMVLRARIGR